MANPVAEPTVVDDGFTDEERTQFESMRDSEAPTGEGAAPEQPAEAPDPVPAPPAAPAVDVKPPIAGAAAAPTEEDEEDEPVAAQPGAPVDPNAKPVPRRVNYQKFARLETRFKDLQAKFNEREQTNARLDERLKLLNEALATPQNQPKADEDPEPDPEKDIFGHNAWLKRQLAKQGETLKSIQEGSQNQTDEQRIASTYETDARQFVAQEPNFIPAYQHLMGVRLAQLAMYYYGKDISDPESGTLDAKQIEHIKQIAAGEERQVVAEALKAGQSPAQRIFQLARASGFRPQAPAVTNGAAKPNGGAPPAAKPNGNGAAPAAAAQPSVSDEIARIKAGQEASVSLSGGGATPTNPLNAERLASMPQAEFDRLMDSLEPDEIRALMGG